MKSKLLSVLCMISAPLMAFASNEGVPSYYRQQKPVNANRMAYPKYQEFGYTNYVGNTGKKQVLTSHSYSYHLY